MDIKDFDIYPLLSFRQREQLTDLFCEVVAEHGYDLDTFDWNIIGTVAKKQ